MPLCEPCNVAYFSGYPAGGRRGKCQRDIDPDGPRYRHDQDFSYPCASREDGTLSPALEQECIGCWWRVGSVLDTNRRNVDWLGSWGPIDRRRGLGLEGKCSLWRR